MKSRMNGILKLAGIALFSVLMPVCSSDSWAYKNPAGGGDASLSAHITNIEVISRSDAVNVMVQGDRLLTYTSVKQVSPLALVLYFSNTALGTAENVFTPPNKVIERISASDIKERRASRIQILLRKNAVYEINRMGNGLKISFSKLATAAPNRSPETPSPRRVGTEPAAPVTPVAHRTEGPAYTQNATRLQSVYAAKFGENLKVFVGADGMITNYKSFTIDSPARIVFDIFNIRSPYKGERVVPVNTRWVSQVRYHSYPDRVRVILDTQKAYLTRFSDHPVENGLLIEMGDRVASSGAKARKVGPAVTGPRANRIESVYASQMNNGMLVTVRGNGMISDYKTSVTRNPACILVDIFGTDSPYIGERSFPVDTRWVKSIRHHRYPDRVQIAIDTWPAYLKAFSAYPDKNGLVVRIGGPGTGAVIADTGKTASPAAGTVSTPPYSQLPQADYTRPARVERVDFLDGEAGKSTLLVSTDRPVQYDIRQTADKALDMKLFNTTLPAQHRRPLITDRFDSAVDRITPASRPSAQNTALFEIRLREGVPYFAEQSGNELRVHFEASSIPPKPLVALTGKSPTPASSEPAPGTTAPLPAPVSVGATPSLPQPSAATLSSAPTAAEDGFDLDKDALLAEPEAKYTGEKIALDFFETDIKNVFRILREVSGKNFAIDKDVTGKVTLTLGEPVPWDQVLDLVLKMNKLGKAAEGNIIRIATRATLDEEEKARQEKRTAELTFKDQQKQLEPLVTEFLPVNYSKAKEEIQPHLEKLLTKDRGSVSVDVRTNMVIMTDTVEKIRQAKDLIRKIDRVTPQVIIEARIVEASESFSREIGTQWQLGIGVQSADVITAGQGDSAISIEDAVTDDVVDSLNDLVGYGPERGYNNLGGTYGYNMGMNFPVSSEQIGSIGFNFVRIAGTPLLLNAKLQAMESKGSGKIVASPKIVTLDNKKAYITQGLDYPYRVYRDGEVTSSFKDVDLKLEVTPHVTPDNRISMLINIEKSDIGSVISGEQSFNQKSAQTELLVNDGDTVVIGGIIKTTTREDRLGIPGLSKLPILGWFFKSRTRSNDKEELLIFITPRILQLEQRTAQF